RRDRRAQSSRSWGASQQVGEFDGRRFSWLLGQANDGEAERICRAGNFIRERPDICRNAVVGPDEADLPILDRQRLSVRSRQAPLLESAQPTIIRTLVARMFRWNDVASGQTEQYQEHGWVRPIDQFLIRLIVIGQKAAVTGFDAVGF